MFKKNISRIVAEILALVLLLAFIPSAPLVVSAEDSSPSLSGAPNRSFDVYRFGGYRLGGGADEPYINAASGALAAASFAPAAAEEDFPVYRQYAIYLFMSAASEEFTDAQPADLSGFADYGLINPEYKSAIEKAVGAGVVRGGDDGYLHVNDYITRAEGFVMLSRMIPDDEIRYVSDTVFSDTPDWAEYEIERLAGGGIINGYGDGTFGADDYLTYNQIVSLIDRLDKSMSFVRNDFYDYVNQEWLSENAIPTGYVMWSNNYQLTLNVNYRTQDIIAGLITDYYIGNEPADGTNEQKILDVYRSAANMTYRDEIGLEPLEEYLEMIDSIDSLRSFAETMGELEKNGFQTLIPLSVNSDFRDSNKYILSFESCYTGVTPSMIKSGEYENVIEAYKSYIATLFNISGESIEQSVSDAEKVTQLCVELGEATMEESKWDDMGSIFKVYLRRNLRNIFTNISMDTYLNTVGYTDADEMVIFDEGLARTINSVINRSNLDTLKLYLKAAVLDYSAFYLNTDMYNAYETYTNYMGGTSAKVDPAMYATSITQDILGLELGRIYIQKYFDDEVKDAVEKMAAEIIDTFEKRINELDWMSEETKAAAVEKLKAIKISVGYPDYIEGYTNGDFSVRSIEDGGSLMESIISYNAMATRNDVEIINNDEPVNKDAWSVLPQSVNAYYDFSKNCIVIPAGILQPPYFNINSSYENNLGGIGSIIAHEITHAFDNTGARFDKDGKLSDWWTDEDYEAFDEICGRFVEQYNDIEVLPGCYVDGELTLSENIADIGGAACIIDIAVSDGLDLGKVFESYAVSKRSVYTEEYEKILLSTSVHAPDKVRVNNVLSNFSEFIDYYNVMPGDGMYRAEEDRITIW